MTTTDTQLPKWSDDPKAYARAYMRRKRRLDPAFARKQADSARRWQLANPVRNAWNQYRQAAARKERVWTLTRDSFEGLVLARCHYCGLAPAQSAINGIDRIDSAKGYTPDNVVTACWQCNAGKRDQSTEEFIAWIRRVIAHQEG